MGSPCDEDRPVSHWSVSTLSLHSQSTAMRRTSVWGRLSFRHSGRDSTTSPPDKLMRHSTPYYPNSSNRSSLLSLSGASSISSNTGVNGHDDEVVHLRWPRHATLAKLSGRSCSEFEPFVESQHESPLPTSFHGYPEYCIGAVGSIPPARPKRTADTYTIRKPTSSL
ncbi:uncharacterized protein EHS24_001449 [Apiotrichum porosum]|uniref:Uncharacterized protein n=1 Tax=Apiotrichum porosum TaxID=105984 RepID=A0A427XKS5_9TREE|nr:uncharacterized protein EHS24_001449 [Apiotrichum porosum]RSH79403.1 hypothetical protein EHS24_001449 [Apiotrichum porosum]